MIRPLISLLAGVTAVLGSCKPQSEAQAGPPAPDQDATETIPAEGRDLGTMVEALEAEAFSVEKEARRFENDGIVPLWDQLLAATPKERLGVFSSLPFRTLVLGRTGEPVEEDLGIRTRTLSPGGTKLDRAKWKAIMDQYQQAGYTLQHTDWHHSAFTRDESGTAISEVRFAIQGARSKGEILDRLQFKGTLRIHWDESKQKPTPDTVEMLDGKIVQRRGPVAFRTRAVIEGETAKPHERDDLGAVNVYDLNGDQLPEIILGNANRILWNKGNFRFEAAPVVPEGAEQTWFDSVVGLVADLNGDHQLDWLSDTAQGDLALWLGKPGGGFEPRALRIKLGNYKLRVPSCITAGDVDQDGDLDLFVGQWRSLYEKMPETFWDANDGFGNTLLLNDGTARFTDATESAGLGAKRFRRAYSASFLDLDADRDLDLLVVSDFRGVDVWLNDGTGKFSEATGDVVDNPYSFGMSHTVADYDRDGRYDFYVLGMGSTTARRLDRMRANPQAYPEANRMRGTMGYGNRMYLATAPGQYREPPFMDDVARTGWSWGSSSFDFDNDGDQDIYAANGHISGKTTRDYCTNFWCRDIYVMKDFPKLEIANYLETLPQMEEQSWDGYQVNPLLVNHAGRGFSDYSFALDVGINSDCRRIVTADLDLDGRMDLLVGRMEGTSGFFHDGKTQVDPPALLILQNVLPEAAKRNWIGVSLQGAPGVSPLGASVTIKTATGLQQAAILSGDSFMCQHPAQAHFGLGQDQAVEELVVNWPNGQTTRLSSPSINTWHAVRFSSDR